LKQKLIEIFGVLCTRYAFIELDDQVALTLRLGNGKKSDAFISDLTPRVFGLERHTCARTDDVLYCHRGIGFKQDLGIKPCK
jgi:hypothetical protein